MVCDKIRSKVQIFYKSQQGTVSAEDKEDMYNLLIETIQTQASVGSFGALGDVASVKVAQETDDGTTDDQDDGGEDGGGTTSRGGDLSDVPDPSGDETTFESNRGIFLGAAGGLAALFGAGYWYAMGEDEEEAEKNEQTDGSDSD